MRFLKNTKLNRSISNILQYCQRVIADIQTVNLKVNNTDNVTPFLFSNSLLVN